jgi:GntR family transcriptional regulator/MocR family aminotransferase
VLKPGDKVPAIRVLAEELKVARKTVETAYAILTGEGYLVSQGARGTRVNPDYCCRATPLRNSHRHASGIADQPARTGRVLRPGIPALDSFPYKKWLLLAGQATRAMRQEEMLNPPVLGWYPLRQAIARYLNISRGLSCTAEQVLITSGYSGSLRLILDTLASRSDKVVFEDPGYFMGQQLLKRIVPRLHTVPVDRSAWTRNTCSATIATPVLPSSPRRTRARWRSRSPCRVNSSCSTGPARTRRGSSKTITTASFTTPARCCRR